MAAAAAAKLDDFGYRPDMPEVKEMEVAIAEVENKLRESILRILKPSLDKTQEISNNVERLNKTVKKHEHILDSSQKLREEVARQQELLNIISDEIQSADRQNRAFEAQTTKDIQDMRKERVDLQAVISEQSTKLVKIDREVSRQWDDLARVQKQHDDTSRKVWEGINAISRRVEKSREQVDEKLSDADAKRNELVEGLYDSDTGAITRIREDVLSLRDFTEPLTDVIKELAQVNRMMQDTASQVVGVQHYVERAKFESQAFQEVVKNSVSEVEEKARNLANLLTAHHGSLMRELRGDYVEEITISKRLRDEVRALITGVDKRCDEMAIANESEVRRTEALHREISTDFDEMQRKRKKDKQAIDADFRDVKQDIQGNHLRFNAYQAAIDHLSRLMGLLIESDKVLNALSVQDLADRQTERWFTHPDESGRRPAPPQKVEALLSGKKKGMAGDGGRKPWEQEPIVVLDWRKGFARDRYLPGAIAFGGDNYERQDILVIHHKLCQKASQALKEGPESLPRLLSQVPSLSCITLQPGASGGGAVGDPNNRTSERREKRDSSSPIAFATKFGFVAADPRELSESLGRGAGWEKGEKGSERGKSNGARQRPGSQGQPQAVGSRGTMFGSLGETAPPTASFGQDPIGASSAVENDGKFRLPQLGSDADALTTPGTAGTSATRASTSTRPLTRPAPLTAR